MERENVPFLETSKRNSDANFSDVFGGPPRRSSMYEMRHRYGFADSDASRGGVGVGVGDDDDESTVPYRGSLAGTREKPVFGEDSANRRRKGNDFFSDIFGGYDSKHHADPFSSKPHSSRISHSSLPAKVMDLPTFGSPTLTSTRNKDQTSDVMSNPYSLSLSQSRFSSQRQEEPKRDVPSFNRQRSLSREVSLDNEEQSSTTKSDLKNGLNGQEVSSHGSQFHFSIYNWASKGVPLMMPRKRSNGSRLKETGVTNVSSISKLSMSRSSSKGSISSENVTSFSGGTKANAKEIDSLLRTGTHSRAGSSQMVVEEIIALSESTIASRVETTVDDVSAATVLDNTREKVKHVSHLKVGVGGKGEKEAPKTAVVKRALNSDNLKPLRSLFNDTNNEQETEGMTVKAGGSKDTNEIKKEVSVEKIQASEKVKKHQEKHIALTDTVMDKTDLKGVARKSESNTGRHKVKGKVKEFAKQFNQEESPKPKTADDSQIQGSRLKGTLRPEKEASLGKAGMDEKFQFNPNKETALQYESIAESKVEECLKQSDKRYSASKTENYISSSTSSKPKMASVSSTDSVPDVSKTVVGDANESFRRDFVMKELPLEKNEKPQPGEDHEDMQAVDAKIRKWSNGKEGNIRSLLSTLQYILWPESGWKPVPLVDIIEGNAVKRAYQRALLRLHPDKLQQKGAASHQKYIAEKVFDILQEAWNQFNSLGSF